MLIGHLSKGYRQRVGLADALLGSPPLLILDEPTAGLDPNQIREVRSLIAELGESHTVLLSTHILSEVEASCSRAIVIAKGRLVADGSIDEIRRAPERAGYRDGAFGRPRLELVLRGSAEKASRAIGKIDGVADVAVEERSDDVVHATVALSAKDEAGAATVIEQIVAALVKAKVAVRSVVPQAASLEQVFAQLTEERPHHDGGTEVAGAAGAQQQAATTELNGQADEAEEDA
jgi:ABC-2 type transport system ATP-binding protein